MRREAGLVADLLGEELVERDVAVRTVLRFGVEHAGEERVHREVAAFDAVVEAAEDGQLILLLPERFQQCRLLEVATGGLREELLRLVAEQVADRHETAGADAGSLGRLDGGVAAEGLRAEGAEAGEGQGGSQRTEDKTATIHVRGWLNGCGDILR